MDDLTAALETDILDIWDDLTDEELELHISKDGPGGYC